MYHKYFVWPESGYLITTKISSDRCNFKPKKNRSAIHPSFPFIIKSKCIGFFFFPTFVQASVSSEEVKMSLSTLGNQLAALNVPGKNVGSTLATSRRHEDAIGRGLSHSVQLGHSISKKSYLHKPSIIYEDSRKASDVPLVTIRENCVSSLRQLESLDPEFGGFVEILCKGKQREERALLTPAANEKVDKILESLLYRLSLRMGSAANNSKTTTASCLHIVEFLLRQYDMHLRPKTASAALLVMLPLHEEPYFLRLVQLIDLASMPAWSFLRPYAIPGAKLARQVISKQASKDTALLREVCRLTQRNSKLPNHAQSLSFAAAVVVEALTLQAQNFGSMEERTCQTILPYVVGACRQSGNEGYQNWGHIIASAIVETSALAEEPRQVLVTSILQGIAGSRKSVLSNGLLVALSTLAQPLDGTNPSSYHLPIIGSSSTSFCGYPMNKSIFQALLDLDGLSEKIGLLYEHEGIKQFSHWIASILVVGWKRLQQKKKESKRTCELIMDLIQEPKLKNLWKKESGKWVESFCSFAILNTSSDDFMEKNDDTEDENYIKSVLQSLRRMDAVAYENGLANALIRSRKADREAIAAWLGLKKLQSSDATMKEPNVNSLVLPPRVALEHADRTVRQEAIEILIQEEEDPENDGMEDDGETVLQALMRRFIDDDDQIVAIAAGKAVGRLLENGKNSGVRELGESSLQAVYKWTESSSIDEKARSLLLTQALSVVAHAAMKAVGEDYMDCLLVRLVECLGAYLNSSVASVSQKSAQALVDIFKGSRAKSKAFKSANLLLVSKYDLLCLYRRNIGKARKAEQAIRRLCMQSLLRAFAESLAAGKKNKDKTKMERLGQEALEYCMWAVASYPSDLNEKEKKLLFECLAQCSLYITSSHENLRMAVNHLAGTKGSTFSEVLSPFIRDICDQVKDSRDRKVSGMAVLMEFAVAASNLSMLVVENLLTIAKEYCKSEENADLVHFGFAPALTLITHENEVIRKKALELLVLIGGLLAKDTKPEWSMLADVCTLIEENKLSALMGDASFLPGCLSTAASKAGAKKTELRKCLLSLCVYAASAFGSLTETPKAFENEWMDASEAGGGHLVAVTILRAAEQAGEDSFPLDKRWQLAGKPILEGFLGSKDRKTEMPDSLAALVDCMVGMLKGTKVTDSISHAESTASVVIMSGPARRGGRTRSYSFGKNDSVSFLKPYPKDMHGLIVSILNNDSGTEILREVQNSLFHTVLRSQSWSLRVFINLSKTVRRKIASGVLMLAMQDQVDLADETLYSLPLEASEVAELIQGQLKLGAFLAAVSYLADYTTMNSRRLIQDAAVTDLFSALFGILLSLSSTKSHDNGDGGFARQATLSALLELSEALSQNSAIDISTDKKFKDWVDLLVSVLSRDDTSTRCLESIRGKRIALALLTSLCSEYPSAVANKLIPAMRAILSNSSSQKEASISVECIALIVPTFLKHSSIVKLSPADMFNAFIKTTTQETKEMTRIKLYQGFSSAIASATKNQDSASLVGAFISSCLAGEIYLSLHGETRTGESSQTEDSSSLSQVASQILQNTPIRTKILVVWTMLSYGKEIIIKQLGEKNTETSNCIVSLGDLIAIASSGPCSKGNPNSDLHETTVKLCNLLMVAVCEAVSSTPFRKFLRQVDGDSSSDILRFWQDLILIQTACQNVLGGSSSTDIGEFWENIDEITNDTLASLQGNLPAHIFLAFASSLIKEGGTEELRARAAQLIADRSASVGASDPEAGLFRDMLPFLTGLLHSRDGDGKLLQQSSLVAIESIARTLCLGSETKLSTSHVEQLSAAIIKSSDLIQMESATLHEPSSFGNMSSSSRQLVCSASLCASTCIRACGPRSLVTLPKLMKPLTSFLTVANTSMSTVGSDRVEKGQAKLMQLSILRSIIAVTETLPQFLAPYLNDLFTPFALPSGWLRKETDDQATSVKNASENLDEILVSHVPTRLLIPTASNAVVKNKHDSDSLLSLLSLLTASTRNSKGSELSGHANTLLKVLTHVFETCENDSAHTALFAASSELFLALVLKLSEVQLRLLYVRLRDWRGDFEKLDVGKFASRRFAFWSLSASLGKELRSIYLPCLSTVFSDAVDELVSIALYFYINTVQFCLLSLFLSSN
jgi:hypothetical protein